MRFKRIFVTLVMLLLMSGGGVEVFASADALAEGTADEFFQDALEGNVEENADTLMQMLSAESIFERVGEMLSDAFSAASVTFCTVAGLILICAVSNRICEGFDREGVRVGFKFISACVISAALISVLGKDFEAIEKAFDGLGALIGSMIPVTAAAFAMGGNVGTASVSSATLYALMAVIRKVCAATVIPVCYVMGMTALCSSLSSGALLGGFTGAVKRIYNFLTAAVMVILVFALGAQTSIATAADTAAARGGKLLTQTLIPSIGGAVGDTLRTVAGSVQYVKSVVGVGGVILVASVTLPPIISLLMTRLIFLVSGGMAQMLGCEQESRLLGELGNIYGCLVGALSICSVVFCVSLGIFVKCAVAVG